MGKETQELQRWYFDHVFKISPKLMRSRGTTGAAHVSNFERHFQDAVDHGAGVNIAIRSHLLLKIGFFIGNMLHSFRGGCKAGLLLIGLLGGLLKAFKTTNKAFEKENVVLNKKALIPP